MGGHQTIDVRLAPAYAGWRLDRALAAAIPTLSRERLKTLIRSGAVEAQGKAVRDPAIKVRGDESLSVAVPEPTEAHNVPQNIPLTAPAPTKSTSCLVLGLFLPTGQETMAASCTLIRCCFCRS